MRKLDWKVLGSFVSVLLGLFALIRETFSKIGVGIEIVEWLLGDGRKVFVEELLTPLGQKFLLTRCCAMMCWRIFRCGNSWSTWPISAGAVSVP